MDHHELLELARDRSDAGRARLSAAVADIFSGTSETLSERERGLMLDILQGLIGSCERSVRQSISEKIADMPGVPLDLAKELANDEVEVAFPILARCKILRDVDLIDVIRNRTVQHQLAIAIRNPVNFAVSDALVETGSKEVITKLLSNKAASISDTTMEYLVDQSQRVARYQEPILQRDDLDPSLAQRMFIWVSAALRQHILDKYQINETIIDDILERTALEQFTQIAMQSRNRSKSAALADALAAEGEATPEMMAMALECGEVALFVSMLQRTTGLRETLLSRFMTEATGEGLAVVARALGMGKPHFLQIYTLCRKAHPPANESFSAVLKKVIALYDEITEPMAEDIVKRWQRNPNYLQAIREIEISRQGT